MIDEHLKAIRENNYYERLTSEIFLKKMIEKYRGKPVDKNTPSIIIPSLDGKGMTQIPQDVWDKEMKEFYKDYQHLM